MEVILLIVMVVGIFLAMLFYSAFTWAFVISKFYGWFILSQFTNLPNITLIHFIGISLFIHALFPKNIGECIKSEYVEKDTKWGTFILAPWIILLAGWIILQWCY